MIEWMCSALRRCDDFCIRYRSSGVIIHGAESLLSDEEEEDEMVEDDDDEAAAAASHEEDEDDTDRNR